MSKTVELLLVAGLPALGFFKSWVSTHLATVVF